MWKPESRSRYPENHGRHRRAGGTEDPAELELHNEIVRLRDLIRAAGEGEERSARVKELNVKLLRFNVMRKRPVNLEAAPEYHRRVMEKLTG